MVFFFVSRGVGGEARLRPTCANPLGQRLFDLSPFFTALWSSCRRTENMRSYAASGEYGGSIHRGPGRLLKIWLRNPPRICHNLFRKYATFSCSRTSNYEGKIFLWKDESKLGG